MVPTYLGHSVWKMLSGIERKPCHALSGGVWGPPQRADEVLTRLTASRRNVPQGRVRRIALGVLVPITKICVMPPLNVRSFGGFS